mmetsp:Transcript_62285/g.146849  ORF Transcript_62285/g.146849 Transcript_62285/m.146849 type:complete len:108 (-) Transcript_62285:277-600(-)
MLANAASFMLATALLEISFDRCNRHTKRIAGGLRRDNLASLDSASSSELPLVAEEWSMPCGKEQGRIDPQKSNMSTSLAAIVMSAGSTLELHVAFVLPVAIWGSTPT